MGSYLDNLGNPDRLIKNSEERLTKSKEEREAYEQLLGGEALKIGLRDHHVQTREEAQVESAKLEEERDLQAIERSKQAEAQEIAERAQHDDSINFYE